jgi:hypothetical protein
MGKSYKGVCLESEKANVWKVRSSAPEAMPKVGISRRPNMNTSNLHTSHPSVPEAMLKNYGSSSTIGELEPQVRMAMGGERPRIPHMVSDIDGSSELKLNPEAPYHLDGKTKIKFGVIYTKGQIVAATKSGDEKVPEYLWDMRALR